MQKDFENKFDLIMIKFIRGLPNIFGDPLGAATKAKPKKKNDPPAKQMTSSNYGNLPSFEPEPIKPPIVAR